MNNIDTTKDCFRKQKGNIIYEMTPYEKIDDYANAGNIFKINGKPVGLTIFGIKNETLLISIFRFDVPQFGNQKRKGYGRIFLSLLIEYAKHEYGCKKVCATDLTVEGEEFFRKMKFNNGDVEERDKPTMYSNRGYEKNSDIICKKIEN